MSTNQTLLDALKYLVRHYVGTMEHGRDRIIELGGTCDPLDVMDRGDPHLRHVREIIAAAEAPPQEDPSEPAIFDWGIREAFKTIECAGRSSFALKGAVLHLRLKLEKALIDARRYQCLTVDGKRGASMLSEHAGDRLDGLVDRIAELDDATRWQDGCCCACGRIVSDLQNLLMMPFRAPEGFPGWGCVTCGLPSAGAIAVVCNACVDRGAEPQMIAGGRYALEGKRIKLQGFARIPHDHDLKRHPELQRGGPQ